MPVVSETTGSIAAVSKIAWTLRDPDSGGGVFEDARDLREAGSLDAIPLT
jgi:hypothetical protein